ncbi:hypothetical protein KR026_004662 [Drosophila bipectinata]|nr:hypothetical protein KR026_004662 [Drosophila bipectinata]
MENKTNQKTKYKLGERKLEVLNDLNFVRNVLQDFDVDSEPQTRGVLLDLAYTLARDQLVEASRYAKMENRTNVTIEDINKAKQVPVEKVVEPHPPVESTEPEVVPKVFTRRKSTGKKKTRPTPNPDSSS